MTPAQRDALHGLIKDPAFKPDMRSARGLVDLGYWEPGQSVKLGGYHALGLMKHAPMFSPVPREAFDWAAGGYVAVLENKFIRLDEDDERGPELEQGSEEFEFSATKILKKFDAWREKANDVVQRCWTADLDRDAEFRLFGVDRKSGWIRNHAWEEATSFDEDIRYAERTDTRMAKALLAPEMSRLMMTSETSNKSSFGDTDWEADFLKREAGEDRLLGEFEITVWL